MTARPAIATALAKASTTIEQIGLEHWRLTLTNGSAIRARARVEDGWLVLAARHLAEPGRSPWSLLDWNGALPGGARLALAPRSSAVLVRADVALEPEGGLGARIDRACADLKAGARCLTEEFPVPLDAGEPPDPEHARTTLAACEETGWPVRACDGGGVLVDLDVPGAVHQAVVRAQAAGALRVAAPVLDGAAPASEVRRRAVASLLLRVGGVVRLVRAVSAAGAQASAGFAVVLTHPTCGEVSHAFAALSVACRLTAAAASVLSHDESLAALYLERAGAAA